MYTKLFWKDTAERVVSTMAQTAIALVTAGLVAVQTTGIDWPTVGESILLASATIGGAGLLALLKALAAGKGDGNPSVGSVNEPLLVGSSTDVTVEPMGVEDDAGGQIPG